MAYAITAISYFKLVIFPSLTFHRRFTLLNYIVSRARKWSLCFYANYTRRRRSLERTTSRRSSIFFNNNKIARSRERRISLQRRRLLGQKCFRYESGCARITSVAPTERQTYVIVNFRSSLFLKKFEAISVNYPFWGVVFGLRNFGQNFAEIREIFWKNFRTGRPKLNSFSKVLQNFRTILKMSQVLVKF